MFRAELTFSQDTDLEHFLDQIAAYMTTDEYMSCEWSYDLRRLRFRTVRSPIVVLAEWTDAGYGSDRLDQTTFTRIPA